MQAIRHAISPRNLNCIFLILQLHFFRSPWISASEVQWQPITKDFIHYIHLSGGEGPVANTSIFNEAARVGPHEQRRTFWNDLYLKYYKAPNPVSSAGKLLSAVVLIVFGQLFIRYSV